MGICHGCGGVIGRDCFNPRECEQITRSMAAEYQSQPDYEGIIHSAKEEKSELISAGWKLIQAMDHYNDCLEGYANGSASMSEAMAAGDDLGKAKSELWDLLKKVETVNEKP